MPRSSLGTWRRKKWYAIKWHRDDRTHQNNKKEEQTNSNELCCWKTKESTNRATKNEQTNENWITIFEQIYAMLFVWWSWMIFIINFDMSTNICCYSILKKQVHPNLPWILCCKWFVLEQSWSQQKHFARSFIVCDA